MNIIRAARARFRPERPVVNYRAVRVSNMTGTVVSAVLGTSVSQIDPFVAPSASRYLRFSDGEIDETAFAIMTGWSLYWDRDRPLSIRERRLPYFRMAAVRDTPDGVMAMVFPKLVLVAGSEIEVKYVDGDRWRIAREFRADILLPEHGIMKNKIIGAYQHEQADDTAGAGPAGR